MKTHGPSNTEDPIVSALRERRLATGLSMPALARKSGVAQATLRNGEFGRHDISLLTLRAWARGLGLELSLVDIPKPGHAGGGPHLVWSLRRHAWRIGRDPYGYTDDLWRARRYTDPQEMYDELAEAGQLGGVAAAVVVRAPEHGRPALTPAEIVEAPALMARRIAEIVSALIATKIEESS